MVILWTVYKWKNETNTHSTHTLYRGRCHEIMKYHIRQCHCDSVDTCDIYFMFVHRLSLLCSSRFIFFFSALDSFCFSAGVNDDVLFWMIINWNTEALFLSSPISILFLVSRRRTENVCDKSKEKESARTILLSLIKHWQKFLSFLLFPAFSQTITPCRRCSSSNVCIATVVLTDAHVREKSDDYIRRIPFVRSVYSSQVHRDWHSARKKKNEH